MPAKKGKPCLILSRHDLLKTRSVKTHFTMLVSVSQDTICQDTFHGESFCHTLHVNFSGSGDRVRGARFCRHLHSAFFSDRVRGVRTCCLLCSTVPCREAVMSMSTMHVFFFKITRPWNNFEFSKLPVTNPEHNFLPGNFLFVRLQIKIVSRIISVIILSPMNDCR